MLDMIKSDFETEVEKMVLNDGAMVVSMNTDKHVHGFKSRVFAIRNKTLYLYQAEQDEYCITLRLCGHIK